MVYTFKKAIVISDQHIPYLDEPANKLVFNFIKDFKPDYIDILGDLIDFYQCSKFLKSPERKETIQDDIDRGKIYLSELRSISPDSIITLHYGNHMTRIKKYIWKVAPELHCIRSLDLDFMLDTKNLNIKTIREDEGYEIRGELVLTHGTIVSQDSAMTARRNLQKYGHSVLCGHTHRLGSHYKSDLRGVVGAWENGCLCKMSLSKEWGREVPNWQTGFSLIFFTNHRFNIQQVPIIENKMLFGEKEYEMDSM